MHNNTVPLALSNIRPRLNGNLKIGSFGDDQMLHNATCIGMNGVKTDGNKNKHNENGRKN